MKWQLLIGDALNSTRHGAAGMHGQGQGGAFRCLMSKQMVGIFVSVWTRSSLCRHVRHPGVCSVGAGVLGRLGNKVRSKQSRTRARHTRGRRSHRHADDGVSTCATYAGRGVRPVLAPRHELLLRLLPPGLRRREGRRAAPERRRRGHPLQDQLPRLRRRGGSTR
jgi:hypothetical protein